MFKLALNAGHWLGTPKGIPANLSPIGKHIDEWSLNDRICDKVEKLLAGYEGYELLRIDDTTGKKDIELDDRTDKANKWGADFYLAIHHNAGVNGGSGGGIVAFIHPNAGKETREWQEALYAALIDATGLKGNRSDPMPESNLHEVRETTMPAVLLELGFMDSTTDAPVIVSEDYADKCAAAIVKVLVQRGKLTKKASAASSSVGPLYRVQTGAFHDKSRAYAMRDKLKAAGFPVYLILANGWYKVQVGAFSERARAEAQAAKLNAAGFDAFITTQEGKPVVEAVAAKKIAKGSTVRVVKGAKTYQGGTLARYVYERDHKVLDLNGDRAVITYDGVVVAAVRLADLYLA